MERVAAMARRTAHHRRVVALSRRFLASDLVVRLAPDVERRRPAEWSTVEHRTVEDRLLAGFHALTADAGARSTPASSTGDRRRAQAAWAPIRPTRSRPVRRGPGALRALVAPAGHGKTTTLHAAVAARSMPAAVVVVGTDPQGGRRAARRGLDAQTIARARRRLTGPAAQPTRS